MSGRALAEYKDEEVKMVLGALSTISERAEHVALAELKNDEKAEAARMRLSTISLAGT